MVDPGSLKVADPNTEVKIKRQNLFQGFTDNVTIGLVLQYLVFVNSFLFNLHQNEFGNLISAVNFRNVEIEMNRNPEEISIRDD